VLGLPLSILVWFVWGFQSKPLWQGLGLLFGLSVIVLLLATLLTPPESKETLIAFYRRCRPPGWWGPIAREAALENHRDPTTRALLLDSVLGILVCLALVVATNALFVSDWLRLSVSVVAGTGLCAWLLKRIWKASREIANVAPSSPPHESVLPRT
jgi:hypothetical protein